MVCEFSALQQMKRILIPLLFFFCGLGLAQAQFNIKIAYATGYGSFDVNNQIMQSYNEENDFLEDSFGDLHFLHGVQIGARYRLGNIGIELSWENLNRKRDAFGQITGSSDFLSEELFYSVKSLSAGLENYFGALGYGGAIERRSLKVKTQIPQIDKKRNIIDQREYSARFYLIFELQQSTFVSLALKPYVQIPLGSYDMTPLETELLAQPTTGSNQEDLMIFGLTIAFYNGPRN